MPKERRVRLAPVPAPSVEPSAALAAASVPGAATARRARRDVRASEHVAALYARVPAETKRRLDIATAMTGRNLSEVVAALLEAHVDPADPAKQAALEELLRR
jgi:predicted DNA-binding protein